MPVTQNRLDFLQQSYLAAFQALGNLCGDKSIVYGVISDGVTVTSGWIAVDGELIPFVGGSYAAKVVITETPTPYTFADGNTHDVEFTKVATCAAVGDFDFADLVPLLALQNIWRPGDVKMTYKDNAYIAANFDVDGYGLNKERGWRILSAVYPDAAGSVMVDLDSGDGDFDECGKTYGEKEHTLAGNEQGSITVAAMVDDIGGGGTSAIARLRLNGTEVPRDGASNQGGWGSNATVAAAAAGTAHNNVQRSFVLLHLIKL